MSLPRLYAIIWEDKGRGTFFLKEPWLFDPPLSESN